MEATSTMFMCMYLSTFPLMDCPCRLGAAACHQVPPHVLYILSLGHVHIMNQTYKLSEFVFICPKLREARVPGRVAPSVNDEKRDRRDSRGDEREGQGRKRTMNESEETEEIKMFSSTLTSCKDSRSCATVSQYLLDALMTQDT